MSVALWTTSGSRYHSDTFALYRVSSHSDAAKAGKPRRWTRTAGDLADAGSGRAQPLMCRRLGGHLLLAFAAMTIEGVEEQGNGPGEFAGLVQGLTMPSDVPPGCIFPSIS